MENYNSVFYPQDESTTMLVPVTVGCPYNACTFCSMYKDESFSAVPLNEIEFQLKHGYEYTEKIFLTGADPLSLGFEKLSDILNLVKKHLPYCARCACYASVRSIKALTDEELNTLHNLGLRLLYIGFESGSDEILRFINKGITSSDSVREAKRLNFLKIPFNSIVMYGIGGKGNFKNHAEDTGKMLSSFKSQKIITMNLTVFENTPLCNMAKNGEFFEESNSEKLSELELLLENTEVKDETLFDTTHPTNIIKIKGRLPFEKGELLKIIQQNR